MCWRISSGKSCKVRLFGNASCPECAREKAADSETESLALFLGRPSIDPAVNDCSFGIGPDDRLPIAWFEAPGVHARFPGCLAPLCGKDIVGSMLQSNAGHMWEEKTKMTNENDLEHSNISVCS
jgi:hypothetical protein